jgi:hypothetical protein
MVFFKATSKYLPENTEKNDLPKEIISIPDSKTGPCEQEISGNCPPPKGYSL